MKIIYKVFFFQIILIFFHNQYIYITIECFSMGHFYLNLISVNIYIYILNKAKRRNLYIRSTPYPV